MCFQGSHDCEALKTTHQKLSSIALATGHDWLCYEFRLKSNPVTTRKTRSRHVSISEPPSRDADSSFHNEQAT